MQALTAVLRILNKWLSTSSWHWWNATIHTTFQNSQPLWFVLACTRSGRGARGTGCPAGAPPFSMKSSAARTVSLPSPPAMRTLGLRRGAHETCHACTSLLDRFPLKEADAAEGFIHEYMSCVYV